MAQTSVRNRPDLARMAPRKVCALPRSDDAEGHSIPDRAAMLEAAGS
jgi:hypothetical protein